MLSFHTHLKSSIKKICSRTFLNIFKNYSKFTGPTQHTYPMFFHSSLKILSCPTHLRYWEWEEKEEEREWIWVQMGFSSEFSELLKFEKIFGESRRLSRFLGIFWKNPEEGLYNLFNPNERKSMLGLRDSLFNP